MERVKTISDSDLFFSLHKLPLFTRFALFSLSDFSLPLWLPIFSLIYSELQVFGIYINTAFFADTSARLKWLNIFHYVHDITSIGDLVNYQNSDFLKFALLAIICIYIYATLVLLIFIFIQLKRQTKIGILIKSIWSFCCFLHPYLLFYPIHFSLVKFLGHLVEDGVYEGGVSMGLQIVAGVTLFLNFAFAFMILVGLQTFIKTANPLSTKTSTLNFLTFGLKVIYPFIWFFFSEAQNPSVALVTVNLAFSAIRDLLHFYILPYYKFKTLMLATGAYGITTLLAIVTFISSLADEFSGDEDSTLGIILWILFVPFYVKFYLSCLHKVSLQILFNAANTKNTNHLAEHWHIYKYFSRFAPKPSEVSPSYKKGNLIYKMYIKQLEKTKTLKLDNVLTLPFLLVPMDYGSMENNTLIRTLVLNSVLEHLKGALKAHPKNVLLDATLAVNYIKTRKLYLMADRHIQKGLQNASSLTVKNSLYLMRLEIIKKLNTGTLGDRDPEQNAGTVEFMDVQDSITSNEMLDILKQKIRAQIKPQLSFWSEFKSHKVELHPLINLSKVVGVEAKSVQSYWNFFQNSTKLRFLEPLLIMGVYASLILENDSLGRSYMKKYFDMKTKNKNDEMKGNALGKNMLSKQSLMLAVSGQTRELGKIIRCYNGVKNSIGLKMESIIGKSINTLMPAFYRAHHNAYLQVDAHTKTLDVMGKTREVHVVNSDGYLVPCYICILLSFMPENGLGYFALLEPMKRSRRVILFTIDGRITNYTQNFEEDMSMDQASSKKDLNVYDFCPELSKIAHSLAGESESPTSTKNLKNILAEKLKNKNKKVSPVFAAIAFGKAMKLETPNEIAEHDEEDEDDDHIKKTSSPQAKEIGNEHKLFFMTLAKENETTTYSKGVSMTTYQMKRDIPYKAFIKVHSNEQGKMIEIVMEREDKSDLPYQFKHSLPDNTMTSFNQLLPKRTQFTEGALSIFQTGSLPSEPTMKDFFSSTVKTIPLNPKSENLALKGASVGGWSSPPDTPFPQFTNYEPPKKFDRKMTTKDGMMYTLSLDYKPTLKNEVTSNPDLFSYRDTMPLSPGAEDRPFLVMESPTGTQNEITFPKETITLEPFSSPGYYSFGVKRFEAPQGDINQPDVEDRSFQTMGQSFMNENGSNFQSKSLEEKDAAETPNEEIMSRDRQGVRRGPPGTASVTGSSVTTNREERSKKVVKIILQSRKLSKFSSWYIASFTMTMLLALGLMLWFSLNAPNVSSSVQTVSDVLQALQLRSFAINLCNQESRLGASMNTIAHDLSLFPSTLVGVIGPTGTIPQSYVLLNGYSIRLQEALGFASEDIQAMFNLENVRLYDRDDKGNKVLIRTTNSMKAVDDIVSNGFLVASYPYPDTELPELPRGFQFVFDNSVDDLLIVAEDMSDVLFAKINESCDTAKSVNIFILVASLLILSFFAIISLYFVIKVNRQFFRFMNVLMTLPVHDTDMTRDQLYIYDKILSQDFEENDFIKVYNNIGSAILIKKQMAKLVKASVDANKNRRQNARSIHADSLTGVYRQNYMSFVQVLIALVIVGAVLIIFYVESQNTIGTLQAKQINMNTAFLNINQQSLVSVQMQSLTLDNDTTTIRNEPIANSFEKTISRLKEIGQLQEALQDSSGHLPVRQRELLYDYPCSGLKTSLFGYLNPVAMNRKCLQITNGRTQVGLSTLLPMMASNLEVFHAEFRESERTKLDLTTLYIKSINMFLSAIDVSVCMFAISYDTTSGTVEKDLDQLTKDSIVMAIAAVLVSAAISILIWLLIVRRMVTKQFDIKQVLSLVPTGLIIDSMHLKGYLMEISREEAKEIRAIERF